MSVEEIKKGLVSLSETEQTEVTAFLFHLRHAHDSDYQSTVSDRLADRESSSWVTPGDLHGELRIHQRVAEITCLIGMFVGFFAPWYLTGTFQPWDIGIGFGLMVIFPLFYIFTVGVYKGIHHTLKRYADYSTMMFAIPWRAQFYWIGLPALLIGFICLFGRFAYPVDFRNLPNKTEQGAAANP